MSICIPTYNRASILDQKLRKLLSQLRGEGWESEIKVFVSDNASEDCTGQVLAQIAAEYPALHCRRNERNLGFGGNLWSVIEFADTDYVLLLGDDDEVEVGCIAGVLDALRLEKPDLLLVNSEPGAKGKEPGVAREAGTRKVDGLRDYLSRLGAFHATFIGNLIFRRSAFLGTPRGPFIEASAYPHMVPALDCLRQGRTFFLATPIVRSNDEYRDWRPMQPIYTSIDLAQIFCQFGSELGHVRFLDRLRLAAFLARSLPRAWFAAARRFVVSDERNPFRSLKVRNVVRLYFNLVFPSPSSTSRRAR